MKNIRKKITSVLVAAATVLCVGTTALSGSTYGLLPELTATVSAAEKIGYMNAAGELKTVSSYKKIKSSTEKLTGGWYIVSGKVTITGRLKVTKDSYLILTDGATLTVKGGIDVQYSSKFNVYTQDGGTGSLYAGTTTGSNTTAGYGNCGIGGKGAKINLVGGNIYARGGSGSYGVQGSDIHLYWTNLTDSVYVSSYSSNVYVLDAFANKAKGEAYFNTEVKADALKGVILRAARLVDSGTSEFDNGAYVVYGSERVTGRIEVYGNAELYLMKGATLTADEGIGVPKAGSLTVYGTNTGKLYAGTRNGSTSLASANDAGIGSTRGAQTGEIIINGGTIYAVGGSNAAGIGGNGAYIEINGGNVTANGGRYGAGIGSGYADYGSTVSITGGVISARGGSNASGIGSGNNSSRSIITLGLSSSEDKITASSYNGTVKFTKTLYTSDGQVANANNIAGRTISAKLNAFTVSFETNGAGYIGSMTVAPGASLTNLPTVTKAGYVFDGWYTDPYFNYRFDRNTPVNSSITLYAKWISGTYTVSFESNGAGYIAPKTVPAGQAIAIMPYVERDGYVFDGWYTDRNFRYKFNINSAINSNLTLYAKWSTGSYTVSFESNGAGYIAPKTVPAGQQIAIMPYVERDGYVFNGWYTDSALRYKFNVNTAINSNLTLYASWTKTASQYTVNFYLDHDLVDTQYIDEGGLVQQNRYNSGYTWKTGSNQTFNFNTRIYQDYDLQASRTVNYTLRFFYDGTESTYDAMTVSDGEYVPLNAFPLLKKGGYDYDGWYTDRACTNKVFSNYYVDGNANFYAKQINVPTSYTVSFDSNGGSYVSSMSFDSDEFIDQTILPTPTRSSYNFTGWYIDRNCTTRLNRQKLRSDITLYAGWEQEVTAIYSVTFDANGGNFTNGERTYQTSANAGTSVRLPEDPIMMGYTFDGWYYDRNGNVPYNYEAINENTILYAHFVNYNTGSTFGGAGLIAAIAGGVVLVGGGIAAGVVANKKKKNK